MTQRRTFLAGLLASALPAPSWADVGAPRWLACARDRDGAFALYGIAADGADTFRLPLPARGHAGAAHPHRAEAVIFARRPGSYALVLDCASGAALRQLSPPDGMQFNGHGAFTEDGREMLSLIIRPGDCWGVHPCLGGYKETNDGIAETGSEGDQNCIGDSAGHTKRQLGRGSAVRLVVDEHPGLESVFQQRLKRQVTEVEVGGKGHSATEVHLTRQTYANSVESTRQLDEFVGHGLDHVDEGRGTARRWHATLRDDSVVGVYDDGQALGAANVDSGGETRAAHDGLLGLRRRIRPSRRATGDRRARCG